MQGRYLTESICFPGSPLPYLPLLWLLLNLPGWFPLRWNTNLIAPAQSSGPPVTALFNDGRLPLTHGMRCVTRVPTHGTLLTKPSQLLFEQNVDALLAAQLSREIPTEPLFASQRQIGLHDIVIARWIYLLILPHPSADISVALAP
jgi:hypothetical protein